jgi:hypothetical protein
VINTPASNVTVFGFKSRPGDYHDLWFLCFVFCLSFSRKILVSYIIWGSQGSSVSIVSVYGLDDRAIEVRSPEETRDFSSNLCVQTGSGAHPVSCPVDTADYSPHPVPRSRMSRSYTLPTSAFMSCSGTALAFRFSFT